jgi:predicted Zn-dependent protease
LFAQLLIHAELKAGRFEQVRERLAARTAARPASAASWRWLADANDGLGEAASAQDARAHAERTLAS